MSANGSTSGPRQLIERQAARTVRGILNAYDAEVKARLPEPVARRFREAILSGVNELASICAEVAEAETEGFILNELALQQIAEIHSRVVEVDADA